MIEGRTATGTNLPNGENVGDIAVWNGARWTAVSLNTLLNTLSALSMGGTGEGGAHLILQSPVVGSGANLNVRGTNADGLASYGRVSVGYNTTDAWWVEAQGDSLTPYIISMGVDTGGGAYIWKFLHGSYVPLTLGRDGDVTVQNALCVPDVTKAEITVDQNDYAIGNAGSLRLSSNATRNITGLDTAAIRDGLDGRLLWIHNVGGSSIVLKNENASSSAENRFKNSGGVDLIITAGLSVLLKYDNTTQRWRRITGA